jgi:hypothetical protein
MNNYFLRKFLKNNKPLTIEDRLFRLVDDYEIYCSFIGREIEIGEVIISPIRLSDDIPSFGLFIPTRVKVKRPDEIWFKDLANGKSGDVFKFVYYFALCNYNIELKTHSDIIKFIDNELGLGLFNGEAIKREKIARVFEPKNTNIYYKSRPFTESDLNYWSQLDINEDILNKFNIKSVKFLLEEDGKIRKEFKRNELVFFYKIWDKGKLYQPKAQKSLKFRNTCPGNDYRYYQGFQQLSGEEKYLIITKSMKDAIMFWNYFNNELNNSVGVIAPHAESLNLPQEFVLKIKDIYKDNIICVSDFDLAGVTFANKCKKHGFHYKFISTKRTLINGKYKVLEKDLSDYRTLNGKEKTLKLLKSWKL